jgi:hypothetical protein
LDDYVIDDPGFHPSIPHQYTPATQATELAVEEEDTRSDNAMVRASLSRRTHASNDNDDNDDNDDMDDQDDQDDDEDDEDFLTPKSRERLWARLAERFGGGKSVSGTGNLQQRLDDAAATDVDPPVEETKTATPVTTNTTTVVTTVTMSAATTIATTATTNLIAPAHAAAPAHVVPAHVAPTAHIPVDPSLPLPLPAHLAAQAQGLTFEEALRISPAAPFGVPLSPSFERPPDAGESQCDGQYCDGAQGALTLGHGGACILQAIPVPYVGDDVYGAHSMIETYLDVEERYQPVIMPDSGGQRHILYRWYAVHIFQVTGRGNRMELPSCVVYRIRRMWPNAAGKAYVGYRR